MKLVFHGKLGAVAGSSEIAIACPPGVTTLSDLRAWVTASMPNMADAFNRSHVATIVNMDIVHDSQHPVTDEDEIAFLPPMSGG
jgi:molybdopterin converting factor small subunit